MIKLIVSDMDGTLLDDDGNLPHDFFPTLEILKSMGIKFIVASGRSYGTLFKNMNPHQDKMDYICNNGAFIVENQTVTQKNAIPHGVTSSILKECGKLSGVSLLISGGKGDYVISESEFFIDKIKNNSKDAFVIERGKDIFDEVYKVSVFDTTGAKKNSYPILNGIFGQDLCVVASASNWVDIMNKTISKGKALRSFQEKLNIRPEETMAFGDYYNDIEMLKICKYGFAMSNAPKEVRKHTSYIAKSNNECGVTHAIKEYVLSNTLFSVC